jgi:hypothetical protein
VKCLAGPEERFVNHCAKGVCSYIVFEACYAHHVSKSVCVTGEVHEECPGHCPSRDGG